MDSHFEQITEGKLSDLVARRLEEPALAGLSDEIQVKAKTMVLIIQLEYELSHLKLANFVSSAPWMNELNQNQRLKVIEYVTSKHLDDDNTVALSWYEKEQRFRLERIISPVVAR